MKLYFRQGIARAQSDTIGSNRTFLQFGRSVAGGQFIDLVVSPDPTIIVFAHYDANYIVEESHTITDAWGPFSGTTTRYLYWDLNRVTSALSRSYTTVEPVLNSGLPPSSPVPNQHWFDAQNTVMKYWDGSKWIECIRVFAGTLRSGAIILPYPIGSQCGISGYDGEYEGGSIIFDTYNKPLLQSDGTFVTTISNLAIVYNAARKIKFESEATTGIAVETIPKFSLVQMRPGRRIALAKSDNYMSRISGIITEDLNENEVGTLISDGPIRNDSWHFSAGYVNRPVFCGINGEVTVTPPQSGVLQAAGYVYDTDTIYMNIFPPVILEDLSMPTSPIQPVPPPGAPVADFEVDGSLGHAPFTVTFTSISTNSPISDEWDFNNDGTVDATGTEVTYTYGAAGVYDVRLISSNGFGSNTIVKSSYITVLDPIQEVGFTNLNIQLDSPATVVQRLQVFMVRIQSIRNNGLLDASNVQIVLTVPDVKSNQIVLSNLPVGTSSSRGTRANIYTLPIVPLIASGGIYGPVQFNVQAPPTDTSVDHPLKIQATVLSPQIDIDNQDNSTIIDFTVRS